MAGTMLADLVFVLVIGAGATILAYWLKQPVVLGYLVAGVLIGPHALGLVRDFGTIEQLAHLGIIFLMLGVGLEFDLRKLRNVGARAVVVAAVQIGVMLASGYAAGRYLGWTPMDSIFLGAIISISSTVIIVKVLTETGKLKEEYAQLAFGVLIIEDIAAIAMVSVLGALGTTGVLAPSVLAATLASIVLFVFLFLAIGLVLVPRFIEWVGRFRVEEVLLVSVVGLTFASALLAERLGFSLALGAFLIGGILAESTAGKRIEHHIVPVRDLFTATFFVAVGMMLRPGDLVTYAWPILVVTLVTIVGKLAGVGLGALIAGYNGRTSVKTAASMAQIGEFGFIIAGLGLSLGVVRPELHPIAVAVCAITSLTTPLFMRAGPQAADALAPKIPRWLAAPLEAYGRLVRSERGFTARPDAGRSRHGTRLLVYAAWSLGATLLAFLVATPLARRASSIVPLQEAHAQLALYCLLPLLAAPFLAAFQRAAESYARARARSQAHTIRGILHARHRQVHRRAVRVGTMAMLGLVATAAAVGAALAPASPELVAPALVSLLVGVLFVRARRATWYNSMERVLDVLLRDEARPHPSEASHPLAAAPFGVSMREVELDEGSPAVHAPLASLDVRRQGAAVLSIQRGDTHIPNPDPQILLLPRDRLTLAGRPRHVEQAARALRGRDA